MPSIAECESRIAKFNADCDALREKINTSESEIATEKLMKQLKKKTDKVKEWTEKYEIASTSVNDTKSTLSVLEEVPQDLLDKDSTENFNKLFEETLNNVRRESSEKTFVEIIDPGVQEIDFTGIGVGIEPVVPQPTEKIDRVNISRKIQVLESMMGIPVSEEKLFMTKGDAQLKEMHKELSDKFNKSALGLADITVNLYITIISGSEYVFNELLAVSYPNIGIEDLNKNLNEYKPQLMEAIMELFQDDPAVYMILKNFAKSYVRIALYTGMALGKSVKTDNNKMVSAFLQKK